MAFSVSLDGPLPTKYVLIIISSHSHLARFLAMSDVVEDRMLRLCTAITSLLEQGLPAATYASMLLSFVEQTDIIYSAQPVLGTNVRLQEWDSQFISLAVTALLQSGCNATIVGTEESKIQHLLDLLSWFVPQRFLERTRTGCHDDFVPDLHLQGVVVQDEGSSSLVNALDEAKIMQGRTPMAVIDVDGGRVYCTNHAPE